MTRTTTHRVVGVLFEINERGDGLVVVVDALGGDGRVHRLAHWWNGRGWTQTETVLGLPDHYRLAVRPKALHVAFDEDSREVRLLIPRNAEQQDRGICIKVVPVQQEGPKISVRFVGIDRAPRDTTFLDVRRLCQAVQVFFF